MPDHYNEDEPMSEDTLCSLVEQELDYALGGGTTQNDSELTRAWEEGLNYYFGRRRGDEIEGRSKVISMDVADMVEQTVAQVMPAFECDQLCELKAKGKQDESQAQHESEVINSIVMDDNDGYMTFLAAIKDGFLQRNGILKTCIEEKDEVDEEVYEAIDAISLQEILDRDDRNKVIEQNEISPEIYDDNDNIIQPAVYSVKIKLYEKTKRILVAPVPPEEFAINADHNSIFLEEARFVCHTRYPTKSDLIQMGYDKDKVRLLPPYSVKTDEEQRARSRDEEENEMDAAHWLGDRVEMQECYYRVDFDGDGIAERRKINKAGKYIFENIIHPIVPFSSGTPFFLSHRFWQISFYDKLRQTQDIKTAFLRKTLDNAEGLINQRTMVINGQANLDDLLSSKPTGVVRVKSPQAVTPFPVQNMGDTGFRMLNYMDKVRKEAAGSQLDIGTQENLPVQGQTAHGMERWMTSQEHLSRLIVTVNAITLIGETFRIVHAMMKRFAPERFEFANQQGELIEVEPGTWPKRSIRKVNIQPSMAEKARIYSVLEQNLQKQIQLYESGAEDTMVSEKEIYKTVIDQLRIAGVDNPEQYWINPESPEAQQVAQQKAQAAQAEAQAAQEQQQQLIQMQGQIAQMQEQSDLMKVQAQNQKNQMEFFIKQQQHLLDQNEQLRKWVDMELTHDQDIPGQGMEGGSAASA